MARINIEECWWSDPRRSALIRIIGNEGLADATAIRIWRLAQEFWVRDRQLVPTEIFNSIEFAEAALRSGLAELRGCFVYVRGSSQYLEWVNKSREAGRIGGLKSAEARRIKDGDAQPKPRSTLEATPKHPRSKSKQTEPSYSSSSSSSNSKTGRGRGSVRGILASSGEERPTPRLPKLAELWNAKSGNLPKVTGCSSSRTRLAEARWREQPEEAYWGKIIGRVAGSSFCLGENDRGWRADFDFLIRPETRHKISEGKYDDRDPSGPPRSKLSPEIQRELEEQDQNLAQALKQL